MIRSCSIVVWYQNQSWNSNTIPELTYFAKRVQRFDHDEKMLCPFQTTPEVPAHEDQIIGLRCAMCNFFSVITCTARAKTKTLSLGKTKSERARPVPILQFRAIVIKTTKELVWICKKSSLSLYHVKTTYISGFMARDSDVTLHIYVGPTLDSRDALHVGTTTSLGYAGLNRRLGRGTNSTTSYTRINHLQVVASSSPIHFKIITMFAMNPTEAVTVGRRIRVGIVGSVPNPWAGTLDTC